MSKPDLIPLKDMDRAVDLAESRFNASKEARESMAVIYHHRGLVFEKLGNQRQADEDFERAEKFGYDPENGVF